MATNYLPNTTVEIAFQTTASEDAGPCESGNCGNFGDMILIGSGLLRDFRVCDAHLASTIRERAAAAVRLANGEKR